MIERYRVEQKRKPDSSCVWKIKDGKADLLNSEGFTVSFINRDEAYASVDLINTIYSSLTEEINILHARYSKMENELSEAKKELIKLRKSNRTGW